MPKCEGGEGGGEVVWEEEEGGGDQREKSRYNINFYQGHYRSKENLSHKQNMSEFNSR